MEKLIIKQTTRHIKEIPCINTEFYGVNCLETEDEYGFEGCYNNDLNHPDPRPAHRIWIKKIHAVKLYKLFTKQKLKPTNSY